MFNKSRDKDEHLGNAITPFPFQMRPFLAGLSMVALMYGLLGAYAWMMSADTYGRMEQQLAQHVSLIEKSDMPLSPIVSSARDTLEPDDLTAEPPPIVENVAPQTVQPSQIFDPTQTLGEALRANGSVGSLGNALPEAPIESVSEDGPVGALPVISPQGLTPFEAYKKPFIVNSAHNAVAVVVADYGLNSELSEKTLALLPSNVTLILSPYASAPQEWLDKARADGHEVWLHLPVENQNFPMEDPGAQGLLSDVSLSYNQDRVNWLLSRGAGYAGVAAFTDEALSRSAPMFSSLFNAIFARGLGYFEMNPANGDFVINIARDKRMPHVRSHATLKSLNSGSANLSALNTHVKSNKRGVFIVEPTPLGLEQLAAWLEGLEGKNVSVAPLSTLSASKTVSSAQRAAAPATPAQSPVHKDNAHDE